MQNEKPQCKNQDSAGGMGNFPQRNLFANIAYTYGTSFIQTHVIRQIDPIYAKQSQFSKKSNGCILNYDKGL